MANPNTVRKLRSLIREEVNRSLHEDVEKIFQIYATGSDGGPPYTTLALFKAVSKDKALRLAARKFKNPDIVKTGFFRAEEVSSQEVQKEIKKLTDQLSIWKNVH